MIHFIRAISIKKTLIGVFTLFTFLGVNAKAIEFECDDNVESRSVIDPDYKKVEDILYKEVITYLDGFISMLTEKDDRCDKWAVIDIAGEGYDKNSCLESKDDIVKVVNQSRIILNNQEKFRSCFDMQKNYNNFTLYTPNKEIQSSSLVSKYLSRPLLSDYYKNDSIKLNNNIRKEGLKANKNFLSILKDIDPNPELQKMSYLGLTDLWSSVGWVPMYAKRESALNSRFRGVYSYAEVVGPWGLLRVKSINQVPFGLELGMTIQPSNTFYPYHFHHAQEIYIDITDKKCIDKNAAYAAKWDIKSNERKPIKNGYQISIPENKKWRKSFASPKSGEIMYFDRNDIHAFRSVNKCGKNKQPGLVSIWARTTTREFDQTTAICQLKDKDVNSSNKIEPAKPEDAYYCNVADLHDVHQTEFD